MGLEVASQRPARMSIANTATGDVVEAQFNPAEFEEALEVNWARQTVPGLSHQPLQFVNTGNVKFTLELEIGTKEESWAESFSVLVVTPNTRPGRTPHTRFLALPRYSHAVLKGHLVKALAASQRDSWEESLLELRKRFFWEWEST